MFPQREAVDVDAGGSAKYVRFGAKLLPAADGKHLHGDGVDVVDLFVCEVDDYFVEAVVLASLQLDGLVARVVSDVSYMGCSEFEELRLLALAAGQEVPSLLRVLRGFEHSAEHLAVRVLTLHGIEGFLEDHFLCLAVLLVQEDVAEARSLAQEVSDLAEDLGLVEFQAEGDD